MNSGLFGFDIGRKSYVGCVNYIFQDKYFFEVIFRVDGNVLFLLDMRWGYFFSFFVGWVLFEELFFNIGNGGLLDFLKLRVFYF